ncbi:uncharacterized protein DS421_4g121750 [Arachis hypogaea]|nr:uncharacterized protein DS421_4g121750 [Arachis hypogaea]
MGLRLVIPEVKFDLKEDEYLEIQEQIRNRNWEILANPETKVGRNMVQVFYANLWQIDRKRISGTALYDYRTLENDENKQGLGQDSRGYMHPWIQVDHQHHGCPKSTQERRSQTSSQRLLDFIGHSILSTSNRSEVTIKRVVMIHCIMLGKEVEVHQLISCELYIIANKKSKDAKLAYPSLISMLYKDARVRMGITEYISVERPIAKMSMEKQQLQDDPIKRRAHEFLLEIPQFEYWEHLEASVSKLQEAMDQIKEEQNNQNSMLC